MAEKDLYALLGVSKNATPDELKSAFRKMAKEHHPDVHPEDNRKHAEEKFKEIGEAYRILSDPKLKSAYDRYGYEGMKGNAGGGFRGQGFDADFDMNDLFGGIFDDFFGTDTGSRGGGRGRNRIRKGEDVRHDINIDFIDAAFGKTLQIELDRKEACEICKGEGIKPGTSKKICKTCGGNGKVRQSQGFFSTVMTCPVCGGAGEIAEAVCETCKGRGTKIKKRKIEVKIPAGVADEQFLKIPNEGSAGSAPGYNGDLYIGVSIREHEYFKREESDIILEMPVTISQAVLGDEVELPGIYGMQKITIPAGTQNGHVITLRGQGFPAINSSVKGDMHIVLHVDIPRGINSKLKDVFKSVKISENIEDYRAVSEFKKKINKKK